MTVKFFSKKFVIYLDNHSRVCYDSVTKRDNRRDGVKIREFRQSKGMTQEQLARRIGTTRSAVAMWEKGGQEPRAKMLIKLADTFECTVDDLLGIERKRQET